MNNITINSNSNDIKEMEKLFPRAPLKIIAMEGCKELGQKVNDYIVNFRQSSYREELKSPMYATYLQDNYLVDAHCPRFGSGEAKGVLNESVRGKDLFIMTDVCNYSLTYSVNGYVNHMSPDDHYQDLKRLISAANGKEHRLNIIMPFLYESRQHKRTKRESLDCALALQELIDMGVDNIFTFDAHDPRVQNAIPLYGFDSFNPPYQFMKALLRAEPNLSVDPDHLMIISPDEGAMSRAVYFSNVIGVDMGMFYKRRDYSTIVNGRNPIVAHEYLGNPVEGKDVFVADDIISSGESMLDLAYNLKKKKAGRIFTYATYAIFTNGLEKFDKAYEEGVIGGVFGTNLTYRSPELLSRPWFHEVDVSKYIAYFIEAINHDVSISKIIDPHEKIENLLKKYGMK